jgi:hypothetical protein
MSSTGPSTSRPRARREPPLSVRAPAPTVRGQASGARRAARLACPLALLLAAVLAAAPAASAATWVGYPELLAQVRSGPLIRAIINPARGDVEIKFRNLDEWHAFYPRAQQAELQRLLAARHIRVLYVPRHQAHRPPPASVHHHLRYYAAGALVLLGLIGGGVYLRSRRRTR